MRAWLLLLAAGLQSGLAAPAALAGTFVFASEFDPDIVAHPIGYAGSGGVVSLSVCVDPGSTHAAELLVPVQNMVNTLRRLEATTGNLSEGATNALASNELDVESVLLHEFGHCLGLDHPNLAVESGLVGTNQEYTRSSDGLNGSFDLSMGQDGTKGSNDDPRGDDANLFYFQKSWNNPFVMEASIFDSTTYTQSLADLPSGHAFAANGDRMVAIDLGFSNTESVMQQGANYDEAQRALGHDDVATLRYAMSGVDELQGTSDDYSLELDFVGLSASCDVVVAFDDSETDFATCALSGAYITPASASHVRLTAAAVYLNEGFNWYFSPSLSHCGNGALDDGEECDDGDVEGGDGCDDACGVEPGWTCTEEPSTCYQGVCGDGALDPGEDCDDGGTASGDCCSSICHFELAGSACDDGSACTTVDACDGFGACVGEPVACDDGLFCNGLESCEPASGCTAGAPPLLDDGVACTDDSCDESADQVVSAPNHAVCDNGQWCDGAERCDALAGCVAGAPPALDDGLACTLDACDEALDAVVHQADHEFCDDGMQCTIDVCDPVGGCTNPPDGVCEAVPATNGWWQAGLALLLLSGGAAVLSRRDARRARGES